MLMHIQAYYLQGIISWLLVVGVQIKAGGVQKLDRWEPQSLVVHLNFGYERCNYSVILRGARIQRDVITDHASFDGHCGVVLCGICYFESRNAVCQPEKTSS